MPLTLGPCMNLPLASYQYNCLFIQQFISCLRSCLWIIEELVVNYCCYLLLLQNRIVVGLCCCKKELLLPLVSVEMNFCYPLLLQKITTIAKESYYKSELFMWFTTMWFELVTYYIVNDYIPKYRSSRFLLQQVAQKAYFSILIVD